MNLAFRIAPIAYRWQDYPKALFIHYKYHSRLQKRFESIGLGDDYSTMVFNNPVANQRDIGKISLAILENFGKVIKMRNMPENSINSEIFEHKRSGIGNKCQDLPSDAPICIAVRNGELNQFIADKLRDLQDTTNLDPEMMVRIRYLISDGLDNNFQGLTSSEIISYVQNHMKVSHRRLKTTTKGRNKKYSVTQKEIRYVLNRMKMNKEILMKKCGRKQVYNLIPAQATLDHYPIADGIIS